MLRSGKLKVDDAAVVEESLKQLQTIDWVVFIQPPPTQLSDPADVLKCLARYMTGGPISDRRIIEVKNGRVYFRARSKDKSGRQVPGSLSIVEFIRCWTLPMHRSASESSFPSSWGCDLSRFLLR